MKRAFRKIAIANRGEVAVRIIRAAQELGLETVLLHSEVDVGSRAYRMADDRYCIGPAPAPESYLHIERNIQGALASGAQALHPGFGFLSENAQFAKRCLDEGLIFVGPSPQSISLMGDKVEAKKRVAKIGIPLLPGVECPTASPDKILEHAKEIGFPVMVKARAGGGGRGMKILQSPQGALELIESAAREALHSFGSSDLFLERYLDHAKHIEFQIFVDGVGQAFHLFDRECTVQRRHQKIIEEGPSVALSEELRQEMGEQARNLAQSVGYKGAGTIEFLLQDDQYYFLEMNTRLQVEHPVTEEILGVDLVKEQFRTAMGEPALWNPIFLKPRGHAIECRIYAEDPYQNGIPSTGVLHGTLWPDGPGRRFEVGFEEGDLISSYYDPMIAKVIVRDETRARAIEKMKTTLAQTVLFGIKTNIDYLQAILSHPEFVDGSMTTQFLERNFPNALKREPLDSKTSQVAQMVWNLPSASSSNSSSQASSSDIPSPWSTFWRGV